MNEYIYFTKEFTELNCKILVEIIGNIGDEEMFFRTRDGDLYTLYHYSN